MSPVKLSIEDDDPWEVSLDIFNLLCDFIQSSSPSSPSTAASNLNALYPDNRVHGDGKKESPASFLLEMWDVVIKVAIQLELDSPELRRLVLLIKTLRDVKPEQMLHVWDRPVILWKDLPLLRAAMTERLNRQSTQHRALSAFANQANRDPK